MKNTKYKLVVLFAPLLLIGCSGLSSDTVSTPVSSTVPATLNFSSTLTADSPILSRVFKDSAGATSVFIINGTCDSTKGDVSLSGMDLTSSTTAPCSGDAFSISIYYSSGIPSFSDDFGGKKITLSQSGMTSVSTTIFKASTTHTHVSLIETAIELASISLTADYFYILANDIDLSSAVGPTDNWTSLAPTSGGINFQGVFDGNGHTISNLNTSSGNGLFDLVGSSVSTSTAVISNLNVTGASITCAISNCGIVVGTTSEYSNIIGVSSSGTITGAISVGGLAGSVAGGVTRSKSNAVVSGSTAAGGLIGSVGASAVISRSQSAGSVTISGGSVGGLIGALAGSLSDSYSTAQANGSITRIGGLIGKAISGASVARCASYGDISASGSILSGSAVGQDLAGLSATSIVFNTSSTCTGCTNSSFTGKTTTELHTQSTYSDLGWDFSTLPVWSIDEGVAYPKLFWEVN